MEPRRPDLVLPTSALRRRCPEAELGFRRSTEVKPVEGLIGQRRALDALEFALAMRHSDYNVFAIGGRGYGKREAVMTVLARDAKARPAPPAYCYVHNFEAPHRPRLLRLPAGRGTALQRRVAELVEALKTAIPLALESEAFRTQREAFEAEAKVKQKALFLEVEAEAKERGIVILPTPEGFTIAPARNGHLIPPDEFEQLPPERQAELRDKVAAIHERLGQMMAARLESERELRGKLHDLLRSTTRRAVGLHLDELRRDFADLPDVLGYLDLVEREIVDNAPAVLSADEGGGDPEVGIAQPSPLTKLKVNVLVDPGEGAHAPVLFEADPSLHALVGRVEHASVRGALVTSFMLIKPGALHLANGGYLVLEARKILGHPAAWEALKRALIARHVKIESMAELLSLASTESLEPDPVPLDLKVVLLGDRRTFELLSIYDPEVGELFKILAEFEEQIDWSPENVALFGRLIAEIQTREGLAPVAAGAAARLVEDAARRAEDSTKISIGIEALRDLLRESEHQRGRRGGAEIERQDVEDALRSRRFRTGRIPSLVEEQLGRGELLIEASGGRVGQVNALSVVDLASIRFGRPSRVSARARAGAGRIVDIEREVELGGAIHSKGVFILQGFLEGRYALSTALSLAASLTFEQSYGMVEGDSASAAELVALLSALSELPVDQGIALTGSVNQHGEIQPIGGVNEKIEGWFRATQILGSTGRQGVIVPRRNRRHLMLDDDVVSAVEAGTFAVWEVDTIDQVLELLLGVEAGARGESGAFPAGSVNARVEDRLMRFAHLAGDKHKDAHVRRGPKPERRVS